MRVVNVVYEAMPKPAEPGGRDCPFIKPAQKSAVDAAMKLIRQQLRCDGYTVNGDMTVWHLYIIELKPLTTKLDASAGYLYVGQTSQPLEDRIRQHREGHHNPKGQRLHSLNCHRRFVRPRFDLLAEQFSQTLYCQEDALTAESDLRLAMEAEGYVVDGGTEKLSVRRRALGIDTESESSD
jgi:predicted GIY-YIG superfamily endonuclease